MKFWRCLQRFGTNCSCPPKECPVKNCRFKLAGREYYAKELDLFHGEKVNVRYDMRDPKRVTVWTLDMEMICEAFLDGNTIEYMVLSEQEQREAQKMRDAIGRIESARKSWSPVQPSSARTVPILPPPRQPSSIPSAARIGPVVDVQPLPEAGGGLAGRSSEQPYRIRCPAYRGAAF